VYQPESINTPEGVAQLKQWQPDLLVVAAYGQILKPDVLAAATHGGINVHASLLPKYRGAAPIAWAIYHGEKQTGVTIIQMSPQLDAGGMIAQETVDIGPDETTGELEARLAPLGAMLAVQCLEQIAAGTAKPFPQDKSQVTKAPKLKKEDGLIDWSRDGALVCYQIRAMQPWPTAYTFYHQVGEKPLRVIVHRVNWAVADDFAPEAYPLPEPGKVLVLPNRSLDLWVAAKNNTGVHVLELQPAGKRRMSAVEFLRGHPLREGDRFGSEAP
jgi:methionyl-tRNA formyltransferase